ncbi:MAG: hypothetical protein U9Q82_07720 [Chloroflexota bacterium]|nr:hypothetical protein [Chloroflexota bacterium]
MSSRKSGNRYALLMYRRTWDRLWKPTFLLGAVLGIVWWQAGTAKLTLVQNANNLWVLIGAVVSFGTGLFAFFLRKMSYVQPYRSHFRLTTPFLRLKIAYRRIRSIHPVDMTQLFPPSEQGWAQRRFLTPLYGKTGVAVELRGYPLPRLLLRLFLPHQFFLPQVTGFVLLVEDWMKLSIELDARIGAWQSRQKQGKQEVSLLESIRRQDKNW